MNAYTFDLKSFDLKPFAPATAPAISLEGRIERTQQGVSLIYHLDDLQGAIAIPPLAKTPERRHELWQSTCFELFIGLEDRPCYWEFNFSPAGHWNIYRFEDYRQGMEEEKAWIRLPFAVQRVDSTSFTLSIDLDLDPIIQPSDVITVGITTIIQDSQENLSYWALNHRGPEADFHRRDSFLIRLHNSHPIHTPNDTHTRLVKP